MRYELSDYEWTAIKPMLPNKPRGVWRVNDRRVLNGIFWVLRSGAPWARPETYRTKTFSCSTRCSSEAYFYIVEMTVRSRSTTRGGL